MKRTWGGRVRAVLGILAKAPWWVALLVGILCMGLGFTLVTKPLSSLGALTLYVGASFIVSGISDLIENGKSGSGGIRMVLGWGWIAAGVVVLCWAGGAMAVLPAFMAGSLLVSGVIRGIGAIRGKGRPADERVSAIILALADLIFGMVALAWPDVTLLLVAVLFGARTLLFGLGRIWNALAEIMALSRVRRRTGAAPAASRPKPFWRWMRVIGAVLSLVLALAVAGLGVQLRSGAPRVDAFYDAPATVPDEPGRLLKSEPFTTGVPNNAKAWRILYTTTRDDSTPAVASAVVLTSPKPASGPRPVFTWAHGTTGLAEPCAPSNLSKSFDSGALPALDHIVDNGGCSSPPTMRVSAPRGPSRT